MKLDLSSDFLKEKNKKRKRENTDLMILFCLIIITIILVLLAVLNCLSYFSSIEKTEVYSDTEFELLMSNTHKINSLEVLNGTRLEDAIPYILDVSKTYDVDVKYFIGISFAESSFNRFIGYNPWGIMVDGKMRKFDSWRESTDYFARLIRYEYLDKGFITPEQIMPKYVGYESQSWLRAVNQYFN